MSRISKYGDFINEGLFRKRNDDIADHVLKVLHDNVNVQNFDEVVTPEQNSNVYDGYVSSNRKFTVNLDPVIVVTMSVTIGMGYPGSSNVRLYVNNNVIPDVSDRKVRKIYKYLYGLMKKSVDLARDMEMNGVRDTLGINPFEQ